MVVSCQQTARKYHNLLIANKFVESVAKFKYWGITVTKKIAFMKKLNGWGM
jgi:hypothetical protein